MVIARTLRMTVAQAEVALLAEEFWSRVGESYGFPRDIERAAMMAFPIVIVKMARLTSQTITHWLRARGAPSAVPLCDSEMAGCLVAHRGRGVIFVAGTDTPREQRATVAHEVAHFIRHYLAVRHRALRAIGPSIVGVLDGDRPATFSERAQSVLQNAPIGVHVHVLPRDDRSDIIARFEEEADELALQLVAPYEVVVEYLRSSSVVDGAHERRNALSTYFGVPAAWFVAYVPDQHKRANDPLGTILTQLRTTR
jgi:hypothetical protein